MHSLPLFVRLKGRRFILAGDGDAADAKRRLLERAGAEIVGPEEEAALAIVAIDDDAQAETIIGQLKARGILVNAVDRPSACDFTLPAIVDRSPVLIAIGTGGASAGLAKALRQRLEAMLPASLGVLATALENARNAMRSQWPGSADRRRAIDAALSPSGMLDPLSDTAADQVDTWLAQETSAVASSFHHLYVTSGDPDDLTLKQARLLGQADMIWYQPGVTPAILNRARADAVRQKSDACPEGPHHGITLYLELK